MGLSIPLLNTYCCIFIISFIGPFLLSTTTGQAIANQQQTNQTNPYKELKTRGFTYNNIDKIKELKEKNKILINKYFNEERGEYISNITEQQKILVHRAYIENLDIFSDQQYGRYDRSEPQPIFLEKERKQRELAIQVILDKCVKLIGVQPYDKYYSLDVKQDDTYTTRAHFFESKREMSGKTYEGFENIFKNIQSSYLEGRVGKCTCYLYGEPYTLKSFDYANQQIEASKKRQIEQLYTQAYLMIKAAGLLVYIDYANYPKALFREFANKAGLTNYIQSKEQIAGKTLDHEQLAIAFFGSREQWAKELTIFINQKLKK